MVFYHHLNMALIMLLVRVAIVVMVMYISMLPMVTNSLSTQMVVTLNTRTVCRMKL